jgi:hypothetical protein
MAMFPTPIYDRDPQRHDDTMRRSAALIALQWRQGFYTRSEALDVADDLGIPMRVIERELGE